MKKTGILGALLLVGCGADTSTETLAPHPASQETRPDPNEKTGGGWDEAIEQQQAIEANRDTSELRQLYEELLSFKSRPDFHELGFGIGSPYHRWMRAVEEWRDSEGLGQDTLLRVSFGNLLMLGMEYMNNEGSETDYTKTAREGIEEMIAGE